MMGAERKTMLKDAQKDVVVVDQKEPHYSGGGEWFYVAETRCLNAWSCELFVMRQEQKGATHLIVDPGNRHNFPRHEQQFSNTSEKLGT